MHAYKHKNAASIYYEENIFMQIKCCLLTYSYFFVILDSISIPGGFDPKKA